MAGQSEAAACKVEDQGTVGISTLDKTIRKVIAVHSQKGQGMRIVDPSVIMHTQHGIQISTYRERSWRAYLLARSMLYALDPRGPDAKVRFKPKGFAPNE